MRSGEIYRIPNFYVDPDNGVLRAKYLLVLACHANGDAVARLLTSRDYGRLQEPPCFHGDPYPGFFLGVLGDRLDRPTWVDLRGLDDVDASDMTSRIAHGATLEMSLAADQLLGVIACVAAANDTTRGQERALRDTLAAMHSS